LGRISCRDDDVIGQGEFRKTPQLSSRTFWISAREFAIYDRYRYDKEKRAALEKWAEVLSGIVNVKPTPTTAPARRARRQNVYEFKARALGRAGDRVREEVGCAPTQSA
jgi:hypothetical protein